MAVIINWWGVEPRLRGISVEIGAFLAQRQALMNAEAVLLVNNGQAEIMEFDAFLKQRMGADNNLRAAIGNSRRAALRAPCL